MILGFVKMTIKGNQDTCSHNVLIVWMVEDSN